MPMGSASKSSTSFVTLSIAVGLCQPGKLCDLTPGIRVSRVMLLVSWLRPRILAVAFVTVSSPLCEEPAT